MGMAVCLVFEQDDLNQYNELNTIAQVWEELDAFAQSAGLTPLLDLIDWDPHTDTAEFFEPSVIAKTTNALAEAIGNSLAAEFDDELRDRLKQEFDTLSHDLAKAVEFNSKVALSAIA